MKPELPIGALLLGAAALPILAAGTDPGGFAAAAPEAAPTVVYLVRHAEKAMPAGGDDPRDPPLSDEGRARAKELARLLAAEEISRIFSTDYRRTRDTAAPLARQSGVAVESYEPDALEELARRLRNLPGRHLVVGHSNTTPELVERLGGSPGAPIDEKGEYDRLYVVIPGEEGGALTLSLRYGKRFRADGSGE